MATIMEKEVLKEMTMATIAKISRAIDEGTTTKEESDPDHDFLWDLKYRLHGSYEWEWDYDETLKLIKDIGDKYEGTL